MDRIWTYYENNSRKVSQYKIEALERRCEERWENDAVLVERLHDFQQKKLRTDKALGT
jgi:hypothetical protein